MNYTNYTITMKQVRRGIFGRQLRRVFSRPIALVFFLGRSVVLAAKIVITPFIFLAAVISWSLGIRDQFPTIRPVSVIIAFTLISSVSIYA